MSEKLFFVGSYCPQDYIEELIKSGSAPDIAGIKLQGAIIKGLNELGVNLNTISIPNRQSYPISKKIFIKSYIIPSQKGFIKLLGFLNLPIIKMFSKFFQMRRDLKKLINKEDNPEVLLYSLHSPFLLAVYTLRKHFTKSCVVVTDLPQYMSSNKNLLYKIGKYVDKKIIDFCLKKIDGFILLSEEMKIKLPIHQKPYIVIEGIYKEGIFSDEKKVPQKDHKIIMYSGSISKRYNIDDLIHAFKKIEDPELQLWLCGSTDYQKELLTMINSDSRIKYWGLLSSSEVKEMQKKVGLLINPRFSKEEYTKYSFPSKTMEYLASGTPTMMCKLPSLPKEYLKYLYLIEDETESGIRKSIEYFYSIPNEERDKTAKLAKDFILREKTEIPQSKKILDFIRSL